MGIRFVDELVPNGRTFPIADQNNIRGGIHYADTVADMEAIHSSRLVPGVMCYVSATDTYYSYDFDLQKWVTSQIGRDALYVCTQPSIAKTDKSSGEIGNLPLMQRQQLEQLTINELLTRALFKEMPPFWSTVAAKFDELKKEVGEVVLTTSWTWTNGTYSYGYYNAKSYSGTIKETANKRTLPSSNYTVGFARNAVLTASGYYDPFPTYKTAQLKTSWDRTVDEYKADNPTLTVPSYAVPTANTVIVKGYVTGYYLIKYAVGAVEGVQRTILEDYSSIGVKVAGMDASVVKDLGTAGQLSASGTVISIGAAGKDTMPNTPFIYVLVPSTMKISNVQMYNGITNTYETVATTRFGNLTTYKYYPPGSSTSQLISNTTVQRLNANSQYLYTYNVWYIAKGDANDKNQVSPSKVPIKVTILNA